MYRMYTIKANEHGVQFQLMDLNISKHDFEMEDQLAFYAQVVHDLRLRCDNWNECPDRVNFDREYCTLAMDKTIDQRARMIEELVKDWIKTNSTWQISLKYGEQFRQITCFDLTGEAIMQVQIEEER